MTIKYIHYKIYTAVRKNHKQKTLDPIIGENQSAAIKNRTILYTFSTIRDVIDVSNKLNKNLVLISLNFREPVYREDWDFMAFISCHKFFVSLFCPFVSLVMGTNSFT